jgi:NAD(P)-dependent dehydrogenase (short-subunit alcohol dehydrogenase family)
MYNLILSITMNKEFAPVLVTGADTGIGRLTVETLSKNGYSVYAGMYLEDNIESLSVFENVKCVKLDVTKPDDIENLVKWIEDEGKGLYGVVNNAGIGETWPLIESTEEEFHAVMNINLYGVFRVTTAVMPFLIESKGRVLTLGSLSGTIPTKFIGAYSVSKFAVEAFTDVLHFETRKFGVTAITIKPGNFQTDISKARVVALKSRIERHEKSKYKEELAPLYENLENPDYLNRIQFEKPYPVAEAIVDALYSPEPKLKYLVADQNDTSFAIKWMCRVIAQLNQRNENAVDKDTLHSMLDKELSKFQ